ncbi:unnamed protein product [Arctogadus glacialis]
MPQFGTAGHGERSRSSSTANSTTGEEIAFSLHTLSDENSKLIAAYLQVIPSQHLTCKQRYAKQPTSSLRHRVMDAPEAKQRVGHIPPDDIHQPYIKIKSAPLIRMAMARPIIPRDQPEV